MNFRSLMQELFSRRKREGGVELLGHLHQTYPTVHVAGTNGKGSVSTKIAKTLELSGLRVGLFTSPHIEHFGERIQINGQMISEEDIMRLLPPLMEKFPDYCFFDYATFLAFQYFAENHVDIAVIEAGIGGLMDTTNVITPLISVITSIGMDHAEILGESLDEIAFQKAGIIKPGVPVVVGPKARFKPIFTKAKELGSPLIEVTGIEVTGEFADFDEENRAIARAALRYLSIPEAEEGLRAKPSCRFERHGRFVLDVAHNSQGFQALLKAWDYHYPGKEFVAIVGLSSDKDLKKCLTIMAERAKHIYLVQADSKRAAPLEKLEEIFHQEKISSFTSCSSMEQAIQRALASDQDILICGSFYIMKQAREQIFGLQIG